MASLNPNKCYRIKIHYLLLAEFIRMKCMLAGRGIFDFTIVENISVNYFNISYYWLIHTDDKLTISLFLPYPCTADSTRCLETR